NLKISPSNNQVMYASRGPIFYRTRDAGATNWTQTTLPGGFINSIAINPTNPDKIAVATSSSNLVFVSNDGGDNWTNYKLNLPNFSALAVVWDDNNKNGLYLGMDYGIYYIDDTFTDWQPYSNLLPNVIINELDINNTTNMLYAGTYGRGLWVSPLVDDIVGIEDVISESTVSIYPNPATSEFTIALPRSMKAEVRVFDITGKLLIYEAEAIIADKHTVNVSSLSSGTYFVRLNTEEGSATKKLLIN
ncbi:MAG: T9SS type A sorting domain-containing protein, partial [Aequorivita sp.]|nr:T9SS type A sorting domain-containing protein [Aequorivita sp.]